MMTFAEAVMEAFFIQGQIGAPLQTGQVCCLNDHSALRYLQLQPR